MALRAGGGAAERAAEYAALEEQKRAQATTAKVAASQEAADAAAAPTADRTDAAGGPGGAPVFVRDASGRFCEAAQYIGDTTLLQSLWRLCRSRGVQARLTLLPPRPAGAAAARDLAGELRRDVQAALGLVPPTPDVTGALGAAATAGPKAPGSWCSATTPRQASASIACGWAPMRCSRRART